MTKPSILYRILKCYVDVAFRFFYHKIKIFNAGTVPINGPVIFAINHQNAFMDAIVIATATKRNPWFLTRASIFQSSTARFWLKQLQMLPVYRFRDGHANMKKNDEAIETCKQILLQNETLLIFPEGNHDRHWALRPLQKGIARIAFATESATDFQSGLHIVPIGLQYENHLSSWSHLLIHFGTPIPILNYKSLYENNPAKATLKLLDDLRLAMSNLIINIGQSEHHDLLKQAIQSRPHREKDLILRLRGDQLYLNQIGDKLPPKLIPTQFKKKLIACFLLLPLFLIAFIPHLPLFYATKLLIKKTVKDDHWTSSIKFGGMIALAPIIYPIEVILLWLLTNSWYWIGAFIILIPLSALFSMHYRAAYNEKKLMVSR
ncbi:MAG: hypothetical protein CVT92_12940 [Bacteroidetes bacterium HGW-Bacteroidetes-1]|jgi:1-acyl-sn-glycerol-3-phosphate acyltransferase|nr:MAG: hypothetical protein CVT92_12940 [Bacteroidetes bacterium HGW-Bacteroidetes-1]